MIRVVMQKVCFLFLSIFDIKESHSKSFQVIEQLFRETTSFHNSPSDTVSKTTILPFYSYRMRFANQMIVLSKGSNKTLQSSVQIHPKETPNLMSFFFKCLAVFKSRLPRT
jgi:hypothetical protein